MDLGEKMDCRANGEVNHFEYYAFCAIMILKNAVKCEVWKWKLN
jgi:hypothetical protein